MCFCKNAERASNSEMSALCFNTSLPIIDQEAVRGNRERKRDGGAFAEKDEVMNRTGIGNDDHAGPSAFGSLFSSRIVARSCSKSSIVYFSTL